MTGATLFRLADEDQVPQLREAGVADETQIRINRQGDVEMLAHGHWSVIGGLLGDFETRIRRLTGQGWH
jgi:hypothetical protein